MNTYRATVTVTKYWVAEKTVTFEVKAASQEEAQKIADNDAADHADFNVSFDADPHETETYISSVEMIDGITVATTRCDRTRDMFTGVIA